MINKISNWLTKIEEWITRIEKIGLWKIFKYLLIGLLIFTLFNLKRVSTYLVESIVTITENFHLEKMNLRDKYMTELNPILIELRSELDADRILYFEYHNSEENLDKTPFKFFDLMSYNVKHSVIGTMPVDAFKDINASQFQTPYNEMRNGTILHCKGPGDGEFREKYQGLHELFNQKDLSKQQILFSVPGVNKPIGFIALEWMSDSVKINPTRVKEEIHSILPKINAAVVSAKK